MSLIFAIFLCTDASKRGVGGTPPVIVTNSTYPFHLPVPVPCGEELLCHRT